VEALHSAQEAFGYLDTDALTYVGRSLTVPPSTVYGVATFYHYFTLKPAGLFLHARETRQAVPVVR